MLENIQKYELLNLIREFPDRSVKWLLETPENVRGLLLIADKNLAKHINYEKLERINQTFILDSFRKLEADMLFVAPFLDDFDTTEQEVMIYILIEHQSTIDPMIPFRVLSYIMQVWHKQRQDWEDKNIPLSQRQFRPVLPIVFYTGNQEWDKPLNMKQLIDLPSALERFIPSHDILFLNLENTPSENLVVDNNPFGWILRVIQKGYSSEIEFGKELQLAIGSIEKIPPEKHADWEKFMIFLWAFITHRRSRDQHERLYNIVKSAVEDKTRREEVEKMGKTMAQALIEEGIEKGLQQGLQQGFQRGKKEGLKEGLYDAISLGLEIKFGADGFALLDKILKIESVRKLEAIRDVIKTANQIKDIEKLIKK